MKTVTIRLTGLLILCSLSYHSISQETLTSDDLFEWKGNGGFGSMEYNWCTIDGSPYAMSGGRGVFILDHQIGIGMGYYSLNRSNYNQSVTALNLGGMSLEYYLKPHKLMFISGSIFGGLASYKSHQLQNNVQWFIEPGTKLWLNISSFMRVSANLSYRLFERTAGNILNMDGTNMGFTIAYGKF